MMILTGLIAALRCFNSLINNPELKRPWGKRKKASENIVGKEKNA